MPSCTAVGALCAALCLARGAARPDSLPVLGQHGPGDEVVLISTFVRVVENVSAAENVGAAHLRESIEVGENRNLSDILQWAQKNAPTAEQISNQVDNVAKASIHKAANATVAVIHMVALAVQKTLGHVNDQAEALHTQIVQANEGFLQTLRAERNASVAGTFEKAGVQTLKTFLTLAQNLVDALEMTGENVGRVLKVAGFLHLAKEVEKDIADCIAPVNQSLLDMASVKDTLTNFSQLVTMSSGRPALAKRLTMIRTTVREAMTTMDTDIEQGLNETFAAVKNHLIATVRDVLPKEYVRRVEADLKTTEPDARSAELHVKQVAQLVENLFTQATTIVRAKLNLPESFARGALPGLAVLVAAAAASLSWP